MDTGVHGSLSIMVFSAYVPSTGLLSNMVVLVLGFEGISILFSIVAVSIYIPTNSIGGFPRDNWLS